MKFVKIIACIYAISAVVSAKHPLYTLLAEDKADPKKANEAPKMKTGPCPKISSNSKLMMTYQDLDSQGKDKESIVDKEIKTAAEVGKLQTEVLTCYKDNSLVTKE